MSRKLTKHVSYKCNCKFDGRKCNSNQNLNNKKCRNECKKHHISETDKIMLHVVVKMVNIS